VAADGGPRSGASVTTSTKSDVFQELGERGSHAADRARQLQRRTGRPACLQVTDFPERLDRVAIYLETVHDRVHRQVQIDGPRD